MFIFSTIRGSLENRVTICTSKLQQSLGCATQSTLSTSPLSRQ